ncbi:MAG: hypothetical protein JNL01_15005 [Bdellovibrionales bacterium]|nr:hypothetical protein [Bdellovibrionales bacterium]
MSENKVILVVDDEKDIVEAYVGFLTPTRTSTQKVSSRGGAGAPAAAAASEYELIQAASAEEALKKVEEHYQAGKRIAGGFFDVKLEGGMDGLSLIRELWKKDPQILCTVVTAYQDRSIDDIDLLFGEKFKDQWDYLNKPFTRAEIMQKARQMVASWNRREQLKLAQEQLIHAERLAAVGQVARGIGHEFGNILQAIVGKADLALMETSDDKVKEKLKTILSASDRASLIVRNLQFFSKKQAAPAKTALDKIFTNTLSLIDHELKKHSVKIQQKLEPNAFVKGNAPELEQVVLNLIINAMHSMPSGGEVELGCGIEGKFARAWVKDTGTGIPPDVLGRIFDFAFTTKGEKGSGLGLSIAKKIMEEHQGKIEVESKVGQGTQFTLVFPVFEGG